MFRSEAPVIRRGEFVEVHVGAGGETLPCVAKLRRDFRYIFLDPKYNTYDGDIPNIDAIRQLHETGAEFYPHTLRTAQLPSGSVDILHMSNVLNSFSEDYDPHPDEDPNALLKETARILKTKSFAMVGAWHTPDFCDIRHVHDSARRYGLKPETIAFVRDLELPSEETINLFVQLAHARIDSLLREGGYVDADSYLVRLVKGEGERNL